MSEQETLSLQFFKIIKLFSTTTSQAKYFFFLNVLTLTWMTLFFLLKTLIFLFCFFLLYNINGKKQSKSKDMPGITLFEAKRWKQEKKVISYPPTLYFCLMIIITEHNYAQVFCLFGLAENTLLRWPSHYPSHIFCPCITDSSREPFNTLCGITYARVRTINRFNHII